MGYGDNNLDKSLVIVSSEAILALGVWYANTERTEGPEKNVATHDFPGIEPDFHAIEAYFPAVKSSY